MALPFVVGVCASAAGPEGDVAFTFRDPAIVESSGLVAQDGLFTTVNDSGDRARVFTVDPDSGDTVGVTTWSPDEDGPADIEALAPAGDGQVWVGDIGDNLGSRDRVSVVKVPVGRGDRAVDVTEYELTYPAQDAESLLADPVTGRLVVLGKGIFGGEVLLGPRELDADRPNRMRSVGVVRSIATDGAFFPDGRHLIVRGYGSANVYTWPALEEVGRFDLPGQEQGEGIAVDEDGAVFLSTEGVRSDVLRVRLPARIARAMAPEPAPTPTDGTSATGEPTADAGEPTPDAGSGSETATEADDRPVWPWLLGGVAGLAVIVVLLRSMRPR
ncbi:hypothetical protein [Nocardioides sp. GXZ039]|uniref:hypothetical protein n=1 Tax=Nocardioides sp. GXZ039 TaxID=3136018 RepID=UPI0030F4A936